MSGHRPNIPLRTLSSDSKHAQIPHMQCMLATGVRGRTLCNIARMCKFNANPVSVAGAVCIADCRENCK
jgi:hypothetical protein